MCPCGTRKEFISQPKAISNFANGKIYRKGALKLSATKKFHITALSVVSCFAVVCLHTSSFGNFSKSLNWIAGNLVESVFYFAVPVFLMISGATLIDYRKRYTTAEFFKKRILKTVIPFLFWSIFGLFFNCYMSGRTSVSFNPIDIVNSVINCKYINIYYFFIILFSVYLSIPVFSLIPGEARRKGFLYIILTAFTVNSLLPFMLSLTNGRINHNGNFSFYACAGYMIYPVIGYYLENYSLSKRAKTAVFALGFAALAVSFFGTWLFSWRAGEVADILKGYTAPLCIFYSSAIFLLFKLFPFERLPKLINSAIAFFSGQTFGIYLIHVFLMQIAAYKFNINPLNPIARLVYAFVLFLLSGIIVKLLQKIPTVKRVVP